MFGGGNSGGFSFGNSNTNNTATNNNGGGLFGNAANKPATTSGFSFGGSSQNTQNTQNNNTSGGFSFGQSQPQQQQQQPAQQSSGFSFGGANNAAKPAGGLFGNTSTTTPASGGLFGNNSAGATTGATGGLFGNNSNNNNNTNNTTTGGGLFGNNNNNTNTAATGGLFGNNNNNTLGGTSTTTGGLFGNNNNTTNTTSGGLFGTNNTNNNTSSGFGFGQPAQTTAPSMFGQQQPQQQSQQQLPEITLTSMTKVSDLPEMFQKEIEELDKYIQSQVNIAELLKNDQDNHKELVDSIPRDIKFLESKYISVNQALNNDNKFVTNFKAKVLEEFNDWVEKLVKLYLQLTNPVLLNTATSRTTGITPQNGAANTNTQADKSSDTPLNAQTILNQYYLTKIEEMKSGISKYQGILQEIENSVNDMDKVATNGGYGGHGYAQSHNLELIAQALKEEFQLYVEIANTLAETHHDVKSLAGVF